jgi:hypothetical protein
MSVVEEGIRPGVKMSVHIVWRNKTNQNPEMHRKW